jgi:hypothetical protein
MCIRAPPVRRGARFCGWEGPLKERAKIGPSKKPPQKCGLCPARVPGARSTCAWPSTVSVLCHWTSLRTARARIPALRRLHARVPPPSRLPSAASLLLCRCRIAPPSTQYRDTMDQWLCAGGPPRQSTLCRSFLSPLLPRSGAHKMHAKSQGGRGDAPPAANPSQGSWRGAHRTWGCDRGPARCLKIAKSKRPLLCACTHAATASPLCGGFRRLMPPSPPPT